MARRPRPLTDHDRAEWASYARQVRVLPGRVAPEFPAAPPAAASPVAPPIAQPPPIRPTATRAVALVTGAHPPGLDNATWNKFRSGKLAAARTLDLHGKTAQSAFNALQRFLGAAYADRIRCVEVITGRGAGEYGGILRRELPLWLNLPALRPLILAAAHPHAANSGSTRLLLRRPK